MAATSPLDCWSTFSSEASARNTASSDGSVNVDRRLAIESCPTMRPSSKNDHMRTHLFNGFEDVGTYSPSNGNTMAQQPGVRDEIRSPNRLKVPVTK